MTEVAKNRTEHEIPKSIAVDINGDKVELNHGNFPEVIALIKESLSPGTPVYIENLRSTGGDIPKLITEARAFLSDGTLNDNNEFGLQKGKYGSAYAILGMNGIRIIPSPKEYKPCKIQMPHEWNFESTNEETFSPAGPEHSSVHMAEGTSKIVIGDQVDAIYEAISGIEFAQDAIHIAAPYQYSAAREFITLAGQDSQTDEQEKRALREREVVAFIIKLLKEATSNINRDFAKHQTSGHEWYSSEIHAEQVGNYLNGKQGIEIMDKYLLLPEDYVIYEFSHPGRTIGYFKRDGFVGDGTGGFFMPEKSMRIVARLAFSKDLIQRIFPRH